MFPRRHPEQTSRLILNNNVTGCSRFNKTFAVGIRHVFLNDVSNHTKTLIFTSKNGLIITFLNLVLVLFVLFCFFCRWCVGGGVGCWSSCTITQSVWQRPDICRTFKIHKWKVTHDRSGNVLASLYDLFPKQKGTKIVIYLSLKTERYRVQKKHIRCIVKMVNRARWRERENRGGIMKERPKKKIIIIIVTETEVWPFWKVDCSAHGASISQIKLFLFVTLIANLLLAKSVFHCIRRTKVSTKQVRHSVTYIRISQKYLKLASYFAVLFGPSHSLVNLY